jgi:hypothetical protein
VCRSIRFNLNLCQALVAVVLLTNISYSATVRKSGDGSSASVPDRSMIERSLGALPLSFELNQGQANPRVKYLTRSAGVMASFEHNEADLYLSRPQAPKSPKRDDTLGYLISADLLRMRLLGSRDGSSISGEEPLPGTVNYFLGSDSAKWHTSVPTFQCVKYSGVYAGTDLVYYGSGQHLEFDFRLAPGADPSAIRIHFDGASKLKLDHDGNLVVFAPGGQVGFHKPDVYQIANDGSRNKIPGEFVISNRRTIGFRVGEYDRSRSLVIDPILNYSTYIGPSYGGYGVAVDSAGEAYVTGSAALNFPTTPGAFQTVPGSQVYTEEAPFVLKFNSTATALIYCTYLSGSGQDAASSIALDANGNAFVAGATGSQDFPVTPGALQTASHVPINTDTGFVTELNSTGTGLIYSTYLGGSTNAVVFSIAVDASESAYVTGQTLDTDFPITAGAFQTTISKTKPGETSGFVAKLNPAGTALVYSTYLAGAQQDFGYTIKVNNSGVAFVGGGTISSNFPITPGASQTTNKGAGDGFVSVLKADGSGLVWSSLLGGRSSDAVVAIAIDSSNNVYATGWTYSTDFPITPGVIGTTQYGLNPFVTKFKSDGSALAFSTFIAATSDGIGGVAEGGGSGIAVDSQGNIIVAGSTSGIDFPVTPGAFETQNLSQEVSGDSASFVSKLNPTGTALLYSTYLSGTGDQSGAFCDCAYSMALDSADNVYVVGQTGSLDFPITPGVYTTGLGMFITQFNAAEMTSLPQVTVNVTSSANPQEYGQPVTFTASVTGSSGSPPTGTVGFSIYSFMLPGLGPWIDVPLNSSGVATYTPALGSLWPMTSEPIAVYYLGDANNAPGFGFMQQTITQIPTVTTETVSPTTITWEQPVTFTAKVMDNTGKPVPGGIAFITGNLVMGGAALDSTGTATWSPTISSNYPLPLGQVTVIASFNDGELGTIHAGSSASVVLTVNPIGIAPTPTFSIPAGTYTTDQTVTVADSNSAATIYYTLDGTTPVVGQSLSLNPGQFIEVQGNETIEAIASVPGYSQSAVASAAYVISIPPPSFTLALSPASITVDSGQSATSQISVNPTNGFGNAVSLSCSGMPTGVSCGFSPTTASPNAPSTLTITAAASAGSSSATRVGLAILPMGALFGLCGLLRFKRRRITLLVLLAGIAVSLCSSCGGGSGSVGSGGGGTTPQTYKVTVTGTSGSLTDSITLTLTLN